ncbi:MAG TPA: VOC family protein [Ramlibacter sp.]|nr:VOC family protein [Ramlibacter sp.]
MSLAWRLDHLHLYAADIEATTRWYQQVFDARVQRARQSDGRVRTDLVIGELVLYLSDAKKLSANLGWTLHDAPGSPHLGLDHFGLYVDDLEGAARVLAERGARITFGPKWLRPGAGCFYVEAPDGVTIEVIHRDLRIDAVPLEGGA